MKQLTRAQIDLLGMLAMLTPHARDEMILTSDAVRAELLALLPALLDIAEAVANAPQVEVTACNQIPGASDFDHGDMLSAILPLKPGTRVAVLPLAGEQNSTVPPQHHHPQKG